MKLSNIVQNYKREGKKVVSSGGKFYTECDTCKSSMSVTTHYNLKGLCSSCANNSN